MATDTSLAWQRLRALVNDREISYSPISDALSRYRIDIERVDPSSV